MYTEVIKESKVQSPAIAGDFYGEDFYTEWQRPNRVISLQIGNRTLQI